MVCFDMLNIYPELLTGVDGNSWTRKLLSKAEGKLLPETKSTTVLLYPC